jgi:hypothetical protein
VRRRALKRDMPRSSQAVHLAASHRLLRMQRYDDPRLASHFKIFSLCSAGRDRGSFLFEMEALGLQMTFYLRAIRAFLGDAIPLRVTLTVLQSGATMSAAANDLSRRIREQVAGVPVDFDPERTVGREYYRTMCFWIHATPGEGKETQLVDGGCVDWTQRLLGDAKERLVVSGVGSDRVCTLRGEAG